MNNKIDCLLIGHNEMNFEEYEKVVKRMGAKTPAYRDLNLNFIQYKNKPYSAPEIFNMFYYSDGYMDEYGKLSLGDTFSAAISYLGTYLHRRGFSFDFVNSFQNQKAELERKLKGNEILTIAVTTTLYVSVFPLIEVVSFIRKHNKTAKIIVGGPFISTNIRTQDSMTLEFVFESIGADIYINSSQGEAALADLISTIKNNGDLSKINNIHYKSKNSYIKTEIKEENNPLNENMVDWTLFKNRLGKFANLRTAISCPYTCAFCGFPQHAGKYQTTDVDKIEQELNSLKEAGNVESINFIDDTFNVPAERFKDILRMMIRNKYNFKWHSYFRCQFADEETISLMKESGCEGVFLGIESGNEQILKNMNKAAALDKYRNGIKLLRENDIITFASFIVGFPGETRETVQDTINFIEETKPDFYRAQLWYCEPITPIWNEKDKYNIKGSNFEWSHATMDAKTGCDLIEEMFLNVKNSVWLSQYNFDFVNLFHMLQRGLSLQEIKHFVSGFNLGIKHKLINTQAPEITSAVVEQLKAVKKK